jgi:SAM-dependent methyltransferase
MKEPIEDADLYDKEYFQSHYTADPLRDAMYRIEYARICERVSRVGRVLDIGCGVGNFLALFERDGWQCYGMEPSAYARKVAHRNNVFVYDSFRHLGKESMDVIIFRGTLQHINYPMDSLVHAWRILKKGGLLVILATPNTDGLVYSIWKDLPPLEAPRNWVLFGNKELVNILKRLGFAHIESVFPYWGTPYAHPARDLFKFVWSLFFGYRKFAFPGSMMEIYAVKGM